MKVEVLPNGKHVISDGDDRIELTRVSYEDVFYAIPIDNGSLYLLLNETVLDSAEARATLKRIMDRMGGVEPAMTELQDLVKEVPPGGKPAEEVPPPPAPEPKEEEKAIVLPNLRKTPTPVPVLPAEPEPEEEEKTIVLPNLKDEEEIPIVLPDLKDSGEEEEEKTILLPNLKETKPAAPTPKTPAPAKPTTPAPSRVEVPAQARPAHPTPAPAKPVAPTPKTPAPAKPAHSTPAAAKPQAASPLPPMAPLKRKEAPPPPATLPAMAPLKKTEHPKPAAAAEPAKTPAGGVPALDFKGFDTDGHKVVKVAKLGADQFVIAYGDMVVGLTRAKYEKLHGMCPAPTSTLFHTLMSEVLAGESKAVFRKIVAAAGHSKPILDAINEQVQALHPGSAVKKG